MTTKSALLRSIGALALFVLIAFPCSTALAKGPCATPVIYYDYHPGGGPLQVFMYSYPPSDPKIFYTTNGTNPTHDHVNSTPTGSTMEYLGPHSVPLGQCITFKALAHKLPYLDSPIATLQVCNLPP